MIQGWASGLRLAAAAAAADSLEMKKKKEDRGGGKRNLLYLPRVGKNVDGWGDNNDEGMIKSQS